jgi:hypothetical protein
MGLYDLFLHRTGAVNAATSRGREQREDTGIAGVPVELLNERGQRALEHGDRSNTALLRRRCVCAFNGLGKGSVNHGGGCNERTRLEKTGYEQ